MKNPDIILKVNKFIETRQLFSRGDTVIVGVSGGADSVALIRLLNSLQYQLGVHLHIAHYNHHLRRGADTDQKFVELLARQLHIPITVGHWKNPSPTAQGSLEDRARRQRMDFFTRLAEKISAHTIALAHTQNDLAETVVMRILRGSGLQGMRGILPLKEMGGLRFVRPLLNTTRQEIEAFLAKNKISFRVDPTNRQTKFFRNKVRLKLLPLLEQGYNSNIQEVLAHLADTMATDYDYLEHQTQKLFQKVAEANIPARITIDLKEIKKAHPALQRMLIRLAIERLKGNTNRLTLAHMREIDDLIQHRPSGSIVHLPDGLSLQKIGARLNYIKKYNLHNQR